MRRYIIDVAKEIRLNNSKIDNSFAIILQMDGIYPFLDFIIFGAVLIVLFKYNILNSRRAPSCTHEHVAIASTAIPAQAWTDPEGSRSLRLPDFKTVDT
jgi:hypothetical protein